MVDFLRRQAGSDEEMDGKPSHPITRSLTWLICEIENAENRGAIYPSMIKSAVDENISRFKGTEQNDCNEFLIEILENLHAELNIATDGPTGSLSRSGSSSFSILTRSSSSAAAMNGSISGKSMSAINWRSKGDQWWTGYRKKENSLVKDLFEGAIRSVMTCNSCGGISARFEPFSQLILSLPPSGSRKCSIVALVNDLFQSESLDGIDCDYCKRKRQFDRLLDIWKLPPFLILTLNRFSFDFSAARKNNVQVDYLEGLSLEDLVAREAPLPETVDYELYGVVEHEGTVNRGHYTAYVKVDDQWYFANDGRVVKVDISTVIGRNAYILFYKWKGIENLEF